MRVVAFEALDEVQPGDKYAAFIYDGAERLPMIFLAPTADASRAAAQTFWDEELAKEQRKRESVAKMSAGRARTAETSEEASAPERAKKGTSRGAKI